MKRSVRPALMAFLGLSVVAGVFYPLAVWALARSLWAPQAEGSLEVRDGRVVGSRWIGQTFTDPGHFWGRPSATVDAQGAALPSGEQRRLQPGLGQPRLEPGGGRARGGPAGRGSERARPVPADLVTASGSGLDPHIRPESALYQAHRVARCRGLDEAAVRGLVAAHTEGPQWGFLGEARVNVLELNLALDTLAR